MKRVNILFFSAFMLMLVGNFSSCGEKPETLPPVPEPIDFCSCLNVKDIDQTIPIIVEVLGDLDFVPLLVDWLSAHHCIFEVFVYGNFDANTWDFLISFEEDGKIEKLILEIHPLKAIRYREYNECKEFPPYYFEEEMKQIKDKLFIQHAVPNVVLNAANSNEYWKQFYAIREEWFALIGSDVTLQQYDLNEDWVFLETKDGKPI